MKWCFKRPRRVPVLHTVGTLVCPHPCEAQGQFSKILEHPLRSHKIRQFKPIKIIWAILAKNRRDKISILYWLCPL